MQKPTPSAAKPEQEPVADGNKVICPACCHQFRAIPTAVQTLMLNAGFEPPFVTPPATERKPLTDEDAAFKDYLNDCDEHAINPDVGSAFHFAWQAAPPATERKPLTDEEIEKLYKRSAGYGGDDFHSFARAIEAAHNIKEQP